MCVCVYVCVGRAPVPAKMTICLALLFSPTFAYIGKGGEEVTDGERERDRKERASDKERGSASETNVYLISCKGMFRLQMGVHMHEHFTLDWCTYT